MLALLLLSALLLLLLPLPLLLPLNDTIITIVHGHHDSATADIAPCAVQITVKTTE